MITDINNPAGSATPRDLPGRIEFSGNKLDVDSAWPLVEAWLETPFEGGRHKARIEKIDSLTRP